MRIGKFITVEGVEGSGKSTNVHFIAERLRDSGVPLRVTREPGGTAFAEQVRQLVLDLRGESIDPLAETMLMFAARRQHLKDLIEPSLTRGEWVLSERFTDATLAYQGGGRGVDSWVLETLIEMVHPGFEPDLTIYLDLPIEVSLKRIQERDAQLDRIEMESKEFFAAVRIAYLAMCENEPRFRCVDGNRPLEEVQHDLSAILTRFLQELA